jgi:hypothetical protein
MPVSSGSSKTLVILRHGDHFTTSSGRWSVILMRDPSPKSRQYRTTTDTKLGPSKISPGSMAPPPGNEKTNLDDYEDSPIQQHCPTEDARISEAIQIAKANSIGHFNAQGSMSANERLHNAVKTVFDAPALSSLDITQSNTVAAEDHLNPNSSIAIHADPSCEYVPPAPDDFQEDRHLKELSINVASKTAYIDYRTSVTKEPYRSIFGRHTTKAISKEAESPETVAPSPPMSHNGKEEDAPSPAAADASDEKEESDGTVIRVKRSTGQKRKQTTYTATRAASPSKKRKVNVVQQPFEEESDTIQFVSRSTESSKIRSSWQSNASLDSSSRKSWKLSVYGSPVASTRPSILSEPWPVFPESTLSTAKSKRAPSLNPYRGSVPKVAFSSSTSVDGKNKIMESFRSFGGSVTKSIMKADILCVSGGALKKTTKFVTAIALGKYVIDERWLVESHRKQTLLDPEAFIPKDAEHEREWDFDLKSAIERGRGGLSGLLDATCVYFTRQLEIDLGANFKDFSRIAQLLGADDMGVSLPTEASTEETVVVIGVDNDPQAPTVRGLGFRLHQKDLLVMGVLRGRIDLQSDDFVVEAPIKSETDA